MPALRLLVAEKRTHPAREAAHKVGESSVEIGAHYFRKIVDLEPHLRSGHLEKLGLRYFFPAGDNTRSAASASSSGRPGIRRCRRSSSIAAGSKTTCSRPIVPTASRSSIAPVVREITFGDPHHTIVVKTPDGDDTVEARWLVDASGRGGLVRRRFDLTRRGGAQGQRELVAGEHAA